MTDRFAVPARRAGFLDLHPAAILGRWAEQAVRRRADERNAALPDHVKADIGLMDQSARVPRPSASGAPRWARRRS